MTDTMNPTMRVGLELHQQLDTKRKLFCPCPPTIRDDPPDGFFIRRLRPTRSELGETDPAALFEFKRGRLYYYEYYTDTTCLVECDDEPPHDMDEEAIDVCLTIAELLNSDVVDEIHPMRKIVIDGSNTSGFQRTAVVALGGSITVSGRPIRIQSICLEEDAARAVGDGDSKEIKRYRLDRLGIPLVEVSTAPDITSPKEAQEVALALGLLLRSTGRVRRGLGTIRQDVNVSIAGGAVIEIKGLQEIELLGTTVELEVRRQERLLQIRDELALRGVRPEDISGSIHDVTTVFEHTQSGLIRAAISKGGVVLAVVLPGFSGLLSREIQPGRRFATELSDYAKFWGGVGGIVHTDELPRYGITAEEVHSLRKMVGARNDDGVVLVASDVDSSRLALDAVVDRARHAVRGVPPETRVPLPDGTTKYARPRPGSERMYPETDVRPVKISQSRLRSILETLPEPLDKKEQRFTSEYGLSRELARQIVRSPHLDLFEHILSSVNVPATLVATTLENTLVSLKREGCPTDNLSDSALLEVFRAVSAGRISPDQLPDLLRIIAEQPSTGVEQAISSMATSSTSTDDALRLIRRVVNERIDYVLARGENASAGLMGIVMKELRGKIDGKTVKQLLDNEIWQALNQNRG
ncbi:MAG: Glu-tRNA(Gln) amidotransferase subunit GatE [Candidatus Thorarchaeota archaeon]